jgi:hypothetical protein
MNKIRMALDGGGDPPPEGKHLTIHNETVKLEANHFDRLASSIQTSLILGSAIKALSKDAEGYDMVLAAVFFVVGIGAAHVLHVIAKNKLGELE